VLAQVCADDNAEAIPADHCFVKAFKHCCVSVPGVLALFVVFVDWVACAGCRWINEVLVLDLTLLRDDVLKVLQFDLKQEQNWHRWLRLT